MFIGSCVRFWKLQNVYIFKLSMIILSVFCSPHTASTCGMAESASCHGIQVPIHFDLVREQEVNWSVQLDRSETCTDYTIWGAYYILCTVDCMYSKVILHMHVEWKMFRTFWYESLLCCIQSRLFAICCTIGETGIYILYLQKYMYISHIYMQHACLKHACT